MATRNSGRNEDRSSSRSGSSASASTGSSSGSRQTSAGASDTGRRAGAGTASSEATRRSPSSGGASNPETHAGAASSGVNTGIGGIGGSSRSDQERQLRTSREEGNARGTSRGNVGQSEQQNYPTFGYVGGTSPFAMMRRMMDDMDRLFSDFGFMRPGLLASSLLGPDEWSPFESSRALGSGQSGSSGTQRSIAGQGSGQQALQRTGQGGLQPWQPGLWSPQIEVREKGKNIVVRADLPGLSRDDVDVEIENDSLIIRGERRNDFEDEQEGVYRSERSYGSFYRAIPLPEGVDPNACNATFKDGVLEVTLPKPEQAQSRGKKIDIK